MLVGRLLRATAREARKAPRTARSLLAVNEDGPQGPDAAFAGCPAARGINRYFVDKRMIVRFEPAGIEVAAEPGARIVDLTDEHPEANVPYSCRSATCGTCRVEIVEGGDALAPPESDEQDILDIFGDGPNVRLACQAKIAVPRPRIVVRVVDP